MLREQTTFPDRDYVTAEDDSILFRIRPTPNLPPSNLGPIPWPTIPHGMIKHEHCDTVWLAPSEIESCWICGDKCEVPEMVGVPDHVYAMGGWVPPLGSTV